MVWKGPGRKILIGLLDLHLQLAVRVDIMTEKPQLEGPEPSLFDDWETMLFMGLGLFFFAGMALFVGLISAQNNLSKGESVMEGAGFIFLGICAPITAFPGLISLALGYKGRQKARHLEQVAGMLKANRRITMTRLATKLGVNELEAEQLIGRCLKAGLVQGYIDRQTDEFFTRESLEQRAPVSNCPHCGAPPDGVHLEGEQVRCGSCGSFLSGPPSGSND